MRCDGPRNRFQGNENEARVNACTNTLMRPFVRRREALRAASKEAFSIIWEREREGEREGRCVIEFVGKSEREANCKSPESGTAGGRPRRGIRRRQRSTTRKTRATGSVLQIEVGVHQVFASFSSGRDRRCPTPILGQDANLNYKSQYWKRQTGSLSYATLRISR